MLIVRKTISMEKRLSAATDIKKLWATCMFLMKKIGLSVLTLNTIHKTMDVGPCHHGMARPQVADGAMASYMEGSCE